MSFKESKPVKTTDEHLALLKSRGLVIPDDEEIEAKNTLRRIGYFRLSGYFRPFQNTKDSFIEGTTLKEIMRLYDFDLKLRNLTYSVIKSIEIQLRSRLTDVMSGAYDSDWYTQENLFILNLIKKETIQEPYIDNDKILFKEKTISIRKYDILRREINKGLSKNEDKEFVVEFRRKHGSASLPSWMMMECISFGALSRLFSLLNDSAEKKAVSKHFGIIMPDVFTSHLHGFVILRNACAHHARIWNKKITNDLKFPKKSSAKFLNETKMDELRKFYGVSACLLHALKSTRPDQASYYKTEFYRLVEEHKITLTAMGFPETLEECDIWRRV